MSVAIYNTLSRQKEAFEPLSASQVKMYCCGVTVYDYCHLGHARSYIVWDTVRRYLSWRGYNVRYIQNFTDIDDKILNRARKENSSMEAVAKEYTAAYFEDMARLNILEADEYTYATHTIDGIKRLIHELEQKGYAYPAKGDVYYSVRKFDGYGKLSGRKLEDMEAGRSGRVGTEDSIKKDPFDFALWKGAKPDEPSWESTWGPGRPGWHIECSAMVRDRLGDTIDIHVGGADLQFPHHENEIAQSEAATGKPLATYWMHNGMVNVEGTKMSKSLGNFTTIRNLLDAEEGPDPMAVRMFVMQSQYRMPLDFTEDAIAAAKNGWATLNEGLNFGNQYGEKLGWSDVEASDQTNLDESAVDQFRTSMDDDFNTPGAIAVLFGIAKELQRQGNLIIHEGSASADPQTLQQQWKTLVTLAGVLGLEAQPLEQSTASAISDADIDELVTQRTAAKQAKNYAESDRIRDELSEQGITLIDKPGGITTWHR